MSNFINTMFVNVSPSLLTSFLAKPGPLPAIFTFAQTQSCMNSSIQMDAMDYQERVMAHGIQSDGKESFSVLEEPQKIYLGSLHNIGETLRRPREHSKGLFVTPPRLSQNESHFSVNPEEQLRHHTSRCLPMAYSSGVVLPSNGPREQKMHAASNSGRNVVQDDTEVIWVPHTVIERQNAHKSQSFSASTSLHSSSFSNPRTRAPFKPQKTSRGTSSWQLKQYAEATLGSGSLRKAVRLPEGEDKDEWLAVNGSFAWTPYDEQS